MTHAELSRMRWIFLMHANCLYFDTPNYSTVKTPTISL